MLKRLVTRFLPSIIFVILLFISARSTGTTEDSGVATRPRLVVVLIIDQFRYDYLVRFRPQFVERGFNLLLSGANFVNCRHDIALTATGPGHAILFTGAYPSLNGIIGNEWYDRSRHRQVNCVEDPEVNLLGVSEESVSKLGVSPRNLVGSTLGDELRIATNFQSRVIGISLKDRAAVLPGGHTANAAYWYDSVTGRFISSTYYMNALPPWVGEFNARPPGKAYCGKDWRALDVIPGAGGESLGVFRLRAGEPCPDPNFLAWLDNTPFMNEIELNFALEAVRSERLGRGLATDLLTISLSANDHIGHNFGPYSPQVADATLRTDRYLAGFFKELDALVGLDNVWIALSADHGVAPNPGFVREHRLGIGNFGRDAVFTAVEQALSQAFGQDHWIEGTGEFDIYLNRAALKLHQVSEGRVEFVAAEAAAAVPGVRATFTRSQFLTGNLPDLPLARKAAHIFNSQRSGDVFFILDPYAIPVQGENETTHGSPWNYDAQVPIILWGSPFKPGVYVVPCQTIDLAPTLAVALELTQPSDAQGQPLALGLK